MRKKIYGLVYIFILVFRFLSVYPVKAKTIEVVIPTPTLVVESDITEPLDKLTKGRLESLLNKQKLGDLSPLNFLKYGVRLAIKHGVPTNTIVLIFLLPLVGVIVSAFYYLIGFTGFGIFVPSMISVGFLATGVVGGLILFTMVLFLSWITNRFLRKMKLHQRSRRAITLWVVSLGTFGLLLLASIFRFFELNKISIFPILFMIILSEEFTGVRLGRNKKKAIRRTLGTLLISILGAILMKWGRFQELVLLQPEMSFLVVLFIGLWIGRYTGFRLMEYFRFRPGIRGGK